MKKYLVIDSDALEIIKNKIDNQGFFKEAVRDFFEALEVVTDELVLPEGSEGFSSDEDDFDPDEEINLDLLVAQDFEEKAIARRKFIEAKKKEAVYAIGEYSPATGQHGYIHGPTPNILELTRIPGKDRDVIFLLVPDETPVAMRCWDSKNLVWDYCLGDGWKK